jgi:hypothetical protein
MVLGMATLAQPALQLLRAALTLYLQRLARARRLLALPQLILPFAFLYGFLPQSVVESAGKYHVLMSGVLCVLLPLLVRTALQSTGYLSTDTRP